MNGRRIGLVIRKRGVLYKIATVFWYSRDCSIYLRLSRGNEKPKGLGKFEVINGRWVIPLGGELDHSEVEHSSVHATGQSHVKTRGQEYFDIQKGIPLTDLKVPRPLWTIAPRLTEDRIINSIKEGDFVLDEPERIVGRVLYLIAFPKANGLNVTYEEELDDSGRLPDLAMFPFVFDEYILGIMLHSNNKIIEPSYTLKIPSYANESAWVESIDSREVRGTFKKIE